MFAFYVSGCEAYVGDVRGPYVDFGNNLELCIEI